MNLQLMKLTNREMPVRTYGCILPGTWARHPKSDNMVEIVRSISATAREWAVGYSTNPTGRLQAETVGCMCILSGRHGKNASS
jgi:hypothetical protein